jgi:hypothetical protein
MSVVVLLVLFVANCLCDDASTTTTTTSSLSPTTVTETMTSLKAKIAAQSTKQSTLTLQVAIYFQMLMVLNAQLKTAMLFGSSSAQAAVLSAQIKQVK